MRMLGTYRPSGALLIAAGALLGLGLIIFGVTRLGHRDTRTAAAAQPVAQLVTAARPIGRGQVIRASDLTTTSVLGRAPGQAIVSPAAAVGKVAVADIAARQLVLTSLVSSDPAAAGLAMLVPLGQRVISIDTTDEIAVGGFLRPGDLVDIEIVLPADVFGSGGGVDRSESRTLLQNIKVITVGDTLGQPEKRSRKDKQAEPSRKLTLALSPDQVGLLTLARKLGRFFLVLRNPNDKSVTPPARTVLARLRAGDPMPRPMEARPFPVGQAGPRRPTYPQAQTQARPQPVELIVGGRSQTIYPGSSN